MIIITNSCYTQQPSLLTMNDEHPKIDKLKQHSWNGWFAQNTSTLNLHHIFQVQNWTNITCKCTPWPLPLAE
jgi:hypothetical protein